MPKQKSHSGAKKRFFYSGTGKLAYRRVGRGHHLTVKGASRKRTLRKTGYVDAANIESLKKLLPYG